MAARFTHRHLLLVGVETTYATPVAGMTGAANAILARRTPEWRPLIGTDDQIDNVRQYFGSQGTRLVQNYATVSIEFDAGGAGAAGTAAPYAALLRACGLAQTLTATVSAAYTPVSAAFESATIIWHDDTTRYQMAGARGSLRLVLEAGKRPYFRAELSGLISTISDVALPGATFTAFRDPLPLSAANTPTLTLGGYSCVAEKLEIDLGNTVEPRFLIGSESIQITNRRVTGTLVLEADQAATKEWVAIARASTRGALSVIHGTVAGNILEIAAPAVEIGRLTFGVSNNIRNVTLPLDICHTNSGAGNDEIVFTIR
ncbi:MAG: hypothetical protein JNM13_15770 [Hyphomicrobiaceae bacterium]|nr:hypothetical protein [Hyphomicrobiaceae bacterium]